MFVYSFCPLSDLSIFVQHPPLQLFLLRSRPAVRVRVLQAVANGSVLYHRPDRRYTLGTYNRTVLWACSHVKPQPNDLRGLMVAPAVGPPSNRSSDKLPLMKPLHFSAIISRALSTHAITRVISAAISSPSDVLTSIPRFFPWIICPTLSFVVAFPSDAPRQRGKAWPRSRPEYPFRCLEHTRAR